MLAAFLRGHIVALVPPSSKNDEVYTAAARIDRLATILGDDTVEWSSLSHHEPIPLLSSLRDKGEPGFVIFSSGTTGEPKAVLHSVARFLSKFDKDGKRLRTLSFLLFDHIAGMDTLFYTLCSGGTLIVPADRGPHYICRLIERHAIEVLPASPTFLNLLCLSGAIEGFDLSSLKIITYGSEPMSPSTLKRVCLALPEVRIIQKYGTSEFGSPRSVSRSRDSLWIKLKDDETKTKIQNGLLWIHSPSAMLGYLNAPNIVDNDGWICTGDRVEQDGEWIQILGRDTDIIIVGGEKVYPQEVENVILELDDVVEAVVSGEPYPLTGQIVTAEVQLREGVDISNAPKTIRQHCRQNLSSFKVPVKVFVVTEPLATERHKKKRFSAVTVRT